MVLYIYKSPWTVEAILASLLTTEYDIFNSVPYPLKPLQNFE